MILPLVVEFNRYSLMTYGLSIISDELPREYGVDGFSLLTGFLDSKSVWEPLYDPVTTVWTLFS